MITTENVICLSEAEVAENYTRVQWAEGLILLLPPQHDSRNSWLRQYGVRTEADALREAWMRENPKLKRPAHWPLERVDPDLILARKLGAGLWPSGAYDYLSGKSDSDDVIRAAIAGIKLGREQGR